jgi:hypothetical protein
MKKIRQLRREMLRKSIHYLLTTFFILQSMTLAAASTDFLRSSGKIYTVVAVLVVILLGLMFFLVKIDRRVRGLEEKLTDNE